MSGFLSTWVGLLSNGVGLLLGERVPKNTPTPLFEQSRKFITYGRIFESLSMVPIPLAFKQFHIPHTCPSYLILQVACSFEVRTLTVNSDVHCNPPTEAKMSHLDFIGGLKCTWYFTVLHSNKQPEKTCVICIQAVNI